MLRFPNPGSDIAAFVRIFKALFQALRTLPNFTLDDMSQALVESNLATSSGHIGDEALRRSTRKDRSRDPLFNQSKMYSELFRILGWIHSLPDKRQEFNFTYLGAHIALDPGILDDLIRECLLHISYPNPHVDVKGDHRVRPIATILYMARELDGRISRDEIILSALQLKDDRDKEEVAGAIERIRQLRKKAGTDAAVAKFATKTGIQLNTLKNYTRFPLGLLRWAGWAMPAREGRGVEYVLTESGTAVAARVKDATDVRCDDLDAAREPEALAFIKLSFYRMMALSGFSLADVPEKPERLAAISRELMTRIKIKNARQFLFSPFQECNPDLLLKAFPPYSEGSKRVASTGLGVVKGAEPGATRTPLIARVRLSADKSRHPVDSSPIVALIRAADRKQGIDKIADTIFEQFRGEGKSTFYPAVADLFKALGLDCTCSRAGVNYQRMDAIIQDAEESVPIEIKSPGEEEFLSVKGVRQALENKVVLLARRYLPTTRTATSLAVGYEPPNDRSEVSSLVSDIHSTYKLSIGVIDFRTLIRLAATKILFGRTPDKDSILHLRGLLEIENP